MNFLENFFPNCEQQKDRDICNNCGVLLGNQFVMVPETLAVNNYCIQCGEQINNKYKTTIYQEFN